MKPVAAGIDAGASGQRRRGWRCRRRATSMRRSRTAIRSRSRRRIAPHLAARRAGVTIDLDAIAQRLRRPARAGGRRRRRGRWRRAGAARRDPRHARHRAAPRPAGAAGRRRAAGLPQSRAAVGGGDSRARPRLRRLGRQSHRSGNGSGDREHRRTCGAGCPHRCSPSSRGASDGISTRRRSSRWASADQARPWVPGRRCAAPCVIRTEHLDMRVRGDTP